MNRFGRKCLTAARAHISQLRATARLILIVVAVANLASLMPAAARAATTKPSDKSVHKVIKTVVSAIRYKKDDLAAKQLAWTPMTQAMLGDNWTKASTAQQKELVAGVETLIRRISFQKGREMFKHLDTISYGPARLEGERVLCKTTIVVHGKAVKREVVIDFVLVPAGKGGKWQISDTIMAGESTTEGVREDQIEDLVDDGGIDAVLNALRKKIAEL